MAMVGTKIKFEWNGQRWFERPTDKNNAFKALKTRKDWGRGSMMKLPCLNNNNKQLKQEGSCLQSPKSLESHATRKDIASKYGRTLHMFINSLDNEPQCPRDTIGRS